jgi:HAD superfamily hydrolase (TIGR01509 family)
MKTILVDALHTFVIKGEGIFRQMYDLLEEYPNKKIVLTNADDEQSKKFGLENLPYPVFTLKHNPDKIDPEYYQKMLETLNLKPHDVVYFEHSVEAVESAKSIGINTFYYDPEKRDLKELKRFLDDNLNE